MRGRSIYCLSKRFGIHSLYDSKEPTTSTLLVTTHRKKEGTACCGNKKSPTCSTYILGLHYETQTCNSVRTIAQLPSNSDLTVIDANHNQKSSERKRKFILRLFNVGTLNKILVEIRRTSEIGSHEY